MAQGELRGAYAKLDWVDEEIAALDTTVKTFGKAEGYTTSSDFYPQANVVAIRIEPFIPPPVWGVRAGNIIHSCRSALDYLVNDLVVLNGEEPIAGSGGNQFPLFTEPPLSRKGNPVSFAEKTSGTLAGVSERHVGMIESLQPYRPENDCDGAPNPLSTLQALSNTDKHQVLRPLMAGLITGGDKVWVEGVIERDIEAVPHFEAILIGPHLKHGAVIACAEVVPSGPDPKMNVNAELPMQPIWDDGYAVFKSLAHIAITVRNILGWFQPVFAGEEPGERPTGRRAP